MPPVRRARKRKRRKSPRPRRNSVCLARKLGVGRARVIQVLDLLKLAP